MRFPSFVIDIGGRKTLKKCFIRGQTV